jgi:hypothetical protein
MKAPIIFFYFLFNYIFTQSKITEMQKIKVRACMKLQSKKYKEEEEKVLHYIEAVSKELNADPKQILFISLSLCYKIIPDQLAKNLHKINGDFQINRNNTLISKIYDFEYYNLDDIEFIKKAYKEFYPIFEVVRQEIQNQKKAFELQFQFTRSPLFQFFLWYTIINTVIVFYRRIKNPPDFTKINNAIDKKDDNKEKEEIKEKKEEKRKKEENLSKKNKNKKKKE